MGRSRKAAAVGHNGPPLTPEEEEALATKYALDIIRDEKAANAQKALYDAARAKVTGHYKMVAHDLKVTRQDFAANVVAVLGMTEAEYLSAERKRQRLHRLAGVAPGEQLDLIEAINDTVDDAIAAESDGYRAGRRADDPTPGENIATMFHPDWLRGYTRGQEVNAKAEALAAEILARPKPGEMAAAEDDDASDGEGEDDLEAEVKRLEETGWVEPTAAETEFEEADNGRTVRAPRAA
jgi:hypothetical protein